MDETPYELAPDLSDDEFQALQHQNRKHLLFGMKCEGCNLEIATALRQRPGGYIEWLCVKCAERYQPSKQVALTNFGGGGSVIMPWEYAKTDHRYAHRLDIEQKE